MKKVIKNNVYWLGKIDWMLRKFHGYEYSTFKGTSYNSYLILEEKTVLIDTVFMPFTKEFITNLQNEIDLEKIDFIVANHGEIDHSGALPELMRHIPDKPIYCTASGIKSIKGHYHQDWNFIPVKTGDRANIGTKELIFIETPMMHWPDNMFCYLTEDNILFSNDAFGQHYASEFLFNDLVDTHEVYNEAIKYYANILTPFSPQILKKIKEFSSLNLPLDIICTSHGVIWRKNPMQIVEKYLAWANNYQENQVTVIYNSMWGGTRILAENIAKGINQSNKEITVKIFNAATTDKNNLITNIFKSKAIIVGSATINNGILTSVASLIEEVKGMKFKDKKAAVFGCYGWSGEAPKTIADHLKQAGFKVFEETIKVLWQPDAVAQAEAQKYGNRLAEFFE
ncbi:MAG: anaerobic nitric oxide reductase flavorubredoxin [Coxiellaceae bacterium]|jgi:flavorubredoxin|nr:anaerobic nitric oxide reductase flavorubredoxin [Coxiellaceae bacterium]